MNLDNNKKKNIRLHQNRLCEPSSPSFFLSPYLNYSPFKSFVKCDLVDIVVSFSLTFKYNTVYKFEEALV